MTLVFGWTRQLLSLTMPEEQSKDAATRERELRDKALASNALGPRSGDASNRPAAGAPEPAGSVLTEEKLKELLKSAVADTTRALQNEIQSLTSV